METQHLNNEQLRFGQVNTCVGTLQLRNLSTHQIGGGLVLVMFFGFLILFFRLPLTIAGVAFGISFVIFLLWGGRDYTKELEKWYKNRSYYSESVCADESSPVPAPVYHGEMFTKEGKKRLYKFERELGLRGLVSYEKDRAKPGMYVLQKPINQYKVVSLAREKIGQVIHVIVAFKVGGFSPSKTDAQSMIALDRIERLFSSLPNVQFKFYWDCHTSAQAYCHQQANLLRAKDHDPLSEAIIISRGKRAVRLEKANEIVETTLRIYARVEVVLGADYTVAQTWKDKEMAKYWPVLEDIASFVRSRITSAPAQKVTSQTWMNAIDSAYTTCCLPVFKLLTQARGLGLNAKMLTVNDFFAQDWGENHPSASGKCPRYSRVTKQGIDYVKTDPSDLHLMSILFTPEQMQLSTDSDPQFVPAVPVFTQTSVYLPLLNQWAGCLKVGQQLAYEAEEDNSQARGHLRFLWRRMQGVSNFRLISEVAGIDPVVQIKRIKTGTKNRTRRIEDAATREHTQDFGSSQELMDLVDAGHAVKSGKRTTSIATTIWLYRDTEDELDEALRSLATKNFPSGTSEVCQSLLGRRYLESLPYAWSSMHYAPHNRRENYLTAQAIPLLPFTQHQPLDRQGILFTGKDIPVSYYLDLLFRKNHTAIFAKSGGGKSLIGLEAILECVFHDIPALILDSPKGEGDSTYTPLMNALAAFGVKCAYHNIRKANLNVLGFPPGAALSPVVVQNHVDLLVAIVIGNNKANPLAETIEALISSSHRAFFATADLWTERPILEDYYRFFVQWSERYKAEQHPEQRQLDAISDIRLQLEGCLASSWGQRLNAQTSFDSDINVLVLGLTNATEDSKETLIYALAGMNLIDQQSAKYHRSLLAMDEGSTIIRFDAVASKFARTFSEGRKMGRNGLFLATDLDNLWASPYAQTLIANFDNILCGLTNTKYMDRFVDLMGFKPNILGSYTTKPDKRSLKSNWYLQRMDGDLHVEVEYHTTPLMLAIGATEPEENRARERVMARYATPLEGFQAFALELARAYSQGLDANSIP
ncbi:MAG: hypothetical protein HC851_13485 [Acaryochloris sp. RU_4_1]|nr:hypothetical protein [Acaryochloris sp. RU_4_1]